MKNILSKIAAPFVAIWRWIKETAWVQPLLIVGIIFGIIFSIPSITKWIQNLVDSADDGLDYYETVQLTLDKAYKHESKADEFFIAYNDAQDYKNGDATKKDQYDAFKNTYGEKFYLVLCESNCANCETISDGLEELKDNWTSKYSMPSNEQYKCWSIVANQEPDYEDDYYHEKKAFQFILDQYSNFFEDLNIVRRDCAYTSNLESGAKTTMETNIKDYMDGKLSSLQIPLVMVFDLTDNVSSNGADWKWLVNTLFFSIPNEYSENSVKVAEFLSQAWLGTKDFKLK